MNLRDIAKKGLGVTRAVVFDDRKITRAVKNPSIKNLASAGLEVAMLAPMAKGGKVAKLASKSGGLREAAKVALRQRPTNWEKALAGMSNRSVKENLTPILYRK